MSMEITVQPLNLAAVVFNKEEMAVAVATINERYAGLVVTDKAEAKRDRAEVNKLLKQIDDARKAVKKQYEAPLKAFEADIKEIVEPLKQSAAAIDEQIKRIEEQERVERKAALETVYHDLGSAVPLSRVWDNSWVNASTSAKKAAEDLTAAIKAAEADVIAIVNAGGAHTAALLDRYYKGATLAEVMAYNAELNRVVQAFAIETPQGAKPIEEVAAELAAEDPRNEYTVTDAGIQVTAKPEPHRITVSCTEAQFRRVCDLLDDMGVFFVVED